MVGQFYANGATNRTRSAESATCDYILDKLGVGTRLTETGMGEPKYSRGIAWEMKNADGDGLYIKLKIEEDRVWVLSFHY